MHEDCKHALVLVAAYFDNELEIDSDAGAHFEAMVTLIKAYEAKHYPITPPDPTGHLVSLGVTGLGTEDLTPTIQSMLKTAIKSSDSAQI